MLNDDHISPLFITKHRDPHYDRLLRILVDSAKCEDLNSWHVFSVHIRVFVIIVYNGTNNQTIRQATERNYGLRIRHNQRIITRINLSESNDNKNF